MKMQDQVTHQERSLRFLRRQARSQDAEAFALAVDLAIALTIAALVGGAVWIVGGVVYWTLRLAGF
jgi:hypothetical protein